MPSVEMRQLTFLEEGDGVVVGCAESDAYAVLPPDGAALLRLLGELPVDEAAARYARTYGEPVDIHDFLEAMADLGFIEVREDSHDEPSHPRAAPPVRWHRAGQLLFSPVMAVLATALVAVAVVLATLDPALRPHPGMVFFSNYLVLIEVVVAVGQVPLILVHELCHVLAARRLGVHARIRVGHRLYFVVFETVMDGLVVVPRRQRYLPMLAGMTADLVLAAGLTVGAAATRGETGLAGVLSGVFLALSFTTLVRFGLEFVLFLRTDVYYLILTLTGAHDLHGTSSQIVANWCWRRLGRTERLHDPALWHATDVRAARWYTPVHLLGYALSFVMLATVLLPISWRFLATAVSRILHPDLSSGPFYDAVLLLLLNLAQPAAAGALWLSERLRAERRPGKRSLSPASRRSPSRPPSAIDRSETTT